MLQLTAIIIDDEARSRHALRYKLLKYCPEIELMAECKNGDEGIIAIEEKKPDIVFLDIEMPRMNGFTMLQQLKNRNAELIFTTAYDHYAVRAIRCSALDYLVKPIEPEELKAAVKRAVQKRNEVLPNQRIETLLHNLLDEKNGHARIAIPSIEGLRFIEVNDIIYLQAESNYTFIYLIFSTKLTVSKTLKDFEELMPSQIFIRIHHSCLINKNYVQKYIRGEGGQVVMINGKILDVARRKKEEFMRAIGC
jgi:two-component system LytT family response regulator